MIKKLVIAVVATYIILMGTNYLIHSVWLMPDYDAIPLSHRNIWSLRHRLWIMIVAQFIYSVMFAYVYTRGAEKKPWVAQGIRYGILMALLTVVPATLSQYVVYIIPHELAIKWLIAGSAQVVVAALVVAAIFKDGVAS